MDAYRADRELLRGLRDHLAEPPRDLWARTAASIEREAGRRDRSGLAAVAGTPHWTDPARSAVRSPRGPRRRRHVADPTGRDGPGRPLRADRPASQTVSPRPDATPLAVTREDDLVGRGRAATARSSSSSPRSTRSAPPTRRLAPRSRMPSSRRLTLAGEPQAVVLSPTSDQLVVVSAATSAGGGEVLIVPVPSPEPSLDPARISADPGDAGTVGAGHALRPRPRRPWAPARRPDRRTSPDPNGPRAILTGVVVVGDAAYSADGQLARVLGPPHRWQRRSGPLPLARRRLGRERRDGRSPDLLRGLARQPRPRESRGVHRVGGGARASGRCGRRAGGAGRHAEAREDAEAGRPEAEPDSRADTGSHERY